MISFVKKMGSKLITTVLQCHQRKNENNKLDLQYVEQCSNSTAPTQIVNLKTAASSSKIARSKSSGSKEEMSPNTVKITCPENEDDVSSVITVMV